MEYNVAGHGGESPDPYEVSAENKIEVCELDPALSSVSLTHPQGQTRFQG